MSEETQTEANMKLIAASLVCFVCGLAMVLAIPLGGYFTFYETEIEAYYLMAGALASLVIGLAVGNRGAYPNGR